MTNEELFACFEAYRKIEIRGIMVFVLGNAARLVYVKIQADHAMAVLPDRASFRMMEYIARTAPSKGEWNDLPPLYLDAVTLSMNDREMLDKDDYALIIELRPALPRTRAVAVAAPLPRGIHAVVSGRWGSATCWGTAMRAVLPDRKARFSRPGRHCRRTGNFSR